MSDPLEQLFLNAYDQYAEALYRHCFFRVFTKARAEELVQEVFLRTWEYMRAGEKIENMRAFLYRVANNLVIDEVRKKKAESLDALIEEDAAAEPSYAGHKEVERNALLRQIYDAMKRLPLEAREILVLRYVDDLDPKDIAEVLGITANNASVRLNRAVELLKKYVK
jgi:RNA polymerase sigma-70 factor (ECF subfamily)